MLVLAIPQACLCSLVSGLGKRPEVEGQTGMGVFFLSPRESWSSITTSLASHHSYNTGFCRGRKVQSRTWAHWNQSRLRLSWNQQAWPLCSGWAALLLCQGWPCGLSLPWAWNLLVALSVFLLPSCWRSWLQNFIFANNKGITAVCPLCQFFTKCFTSAVFLSEFNPSFCDRGCILFIL